MGFGICVLGYGILSADIIGFGVIGWAVLAYGLRLVSVLDRRYFNAAICAVCMLPHSAIIAFNMLFGNHAGEILPLLSEKGMLYKSSYIIYYLLFIVFHYLVAAPTARLYKNANIDKLRVRSWTRFYMAAVLSVWSIVSTLFPNTVNAMIGGFLLLYKYIFWLLFTVLFYECFTKITTKNQLARDAAEAEAAELKASQKRKKRNEE